MHGLGGEDWGNAKVVRSNDGAVHRGLDDVPWRNVVCVIVRMIDSVAADLDQGRQQPGQALEQTRFYVFCGGCGASTWWCCASV